MPHKLHEESVALGYKISVIPHCSYFSYVNLLLKNIGKQGDIQIKIDKFKEHLKDGISDYDFAIEARSIKTGEFAGFVCADFQKDGVCYISSIVVLHRYRLKKLGSMLMKHMQAICENISKTECIQLDSIPSEVIIKFYQRLGFKEIQAEDRSEGSCHTMNLSLKKGIIVPPDKERYFCLPIQQIS